MQLILFRHGIAEDAHNGIADADRALTPRGIERATLAARGLARLADRPDAILTSPKIRAAQTAAILGDVFDLVPQTVDALAGDSPHAIQRMLRDRSERELLLVGHEPSLSTLIEMLCVGGASATGFVELKKAGAALVEAPLHRGEPAGKATLHWLIPPRVLRMLGEHCEEHTRDRG